MNSVVRTTVQRFWILKCNINFNMSLCLIKHRATKMYCPLLRRMRLTCAVWVELFNTPDDGRRKTYRSCQKLESGSLHDLLSTGRHLLVSFLRTLQSHRTLHKILPHTHKTRLHFSLTCFELEYIGYWSQTNDGRFSPAQTTAKVNCGLISQYQ
jgi:hypothetical protein